MSKGPGSTQRRALKVLAEMHVLDAGTTADVVWEFIRCGCDDDCDCAPVPWTRRQTVTRQVRRALDGLASRGLVAKELTPNRRWGGYKAWRMQEDGRYQKVPVAFQTHWELTEAGRDYCRDRLGIEPTGPFTADDRQAEWARVMGTMQNLTIGGKSA